MAETNGGQNGSRRPQGNPQRIAEVVCRHFASWQKIPYPEKPWGDTAKWKRFYQLQILKANTLLKMYDIVDILAALNSKEGQFVCSLNNPKIDDLIKDAKRKRENKEKMQADIAAGKEAAPEQFIPHLANISPHPTPIPVDEFYDKIKSTGRKKKAETTIRSKLD